MASRDLGQTDVAAFLSGLGQGERTLLLLRDELYGGSWDELVADLEARQNRKPFVFKLNSRIEEDLERIEMLRAFERETGQDLARLVEEGPVEEGTP